MSLEVVAIIAGSADDPQTHWQQTAVQNLANQIDANIIKFLFIEETGEAAASLSERKTLKDALLRLVAGGVSTLVVASLESLSKQLSDQQIIVAYLGLHKITVLSESKNDPPADVDQIISLRRAMLLSLDLNQSLTQTKLQLAREAKRTRSGKCGGNLPYGSSPGEEATRDLILALYQEERRGYSEICRILHERNIPPRRAASWRPNTIANITGALARKKVMQSKVKSKTPKTIT